MSYDPRNRKDLVTLLSIELMTRLPEWKKEERLNFASEILQTLEIELDTWEQGIEYY